MHEEGVILLINYLPYRCRLVSYYYYFSSFFFKITAGEFSSGRGERVAFQSSESMKRDVSSFLKPGGSRDQSVSLHPLGNNWCLWNGTPQKQHTLRGIHCGETDFP